MACKSAEQRHRLLMATSKALVMCPWFSSSQRILKQTIADQNDLQRKILLPTLKLVPITKSSYILKVPLTTEIFFLSHIPTAAPAVNILTGVGHLLQVMNLHGHTIITQNRSLHYGSLLVVYMLWVLANV